MRMVSSQSSLLWLVIYSYRKGTLNSGQPLRRGRVLNIFDLNWNAVFGAASIGFAVGGLWYGPILGKKVDGRSGAQPGRCR